MPKMFAGKTVAAAISKVIAVSVPIAFSYRGVSGKTIVAVFIQTEEIADYGAVGFIVIRVGFHIRCDIFYRAAFVERFHKPIDVFVRIHGKIAAIFAGEESQDVYPADVKVLLVSFYIYIHGVFQSFVGDIKINPFDVIFVRFIGGDHQTLDAVLTDHDAD